MLFVRYLPRLSMLRFALVERHTDSVQMGADKEQQERPPRKEAPAEGRER